MSDTPRTDALVAELHAEFSNVGTDFLRVVEFARQLERETATRPCGICGEMFMPRQPSTTRA